MFNSYPHSNALFIFSPFEVYYHASIDSAFSKVEPEVSQSEGTFYNDVKFVLVYHRIYCHKLHGPSMFAVWAEIYGVLYNQAKSIAFDETSSYWSALKCS